MVPPRPALVPITTSAPWVRELSGITIPDVSLRLVENMPLIENNLPLPLGEGRGEGAVPPLPNRESSEKAAKPKVLDTRRGSLLFTHFGLSGPVVLDISRHVSGHPRPQSLQLECDFLPDIKPPELDAQLRQQAADEGKKQLLSLVPELLPRRLAEILLHAAGLPADKKAGELSTANRSALVRALKQLPIPITGTRGFAKAEVTAGGVLLDEINSSTLQSKLVPGLYFAGEVLDLDGPIGGYNFQAAFSTGWLAGMSV
jgi:hypothetical protein